MAAWWPEFQEPSPNVILQSRLFTPGKQRLCLCFCLSLGPRALPSTERKHATFGIYRLEFGGLWAEFLLRQQNKAIPHFSLHPKQPLWTSGSQTKGNCASLGTFGNVRSQLGLSAAGWYWCLVCRCQGCWETSYHAQDRIIEPETSVALGGEKAALYL